MTVVDERSRVPALDSAALEKLRTALDRPEVLSAFLFGSRARGRAGPLSDVDIAVLHASGLDSGQRLDLRLALISEATDALGTTEADLVLLNDAPPLLRFNVLRDGIRLLDRDPAERIRFQVKSMNEYFDTEPLRQAASLRLRNRIDGGRFGRPVEH